MTQAVRDYPWQELPRHRRAELGVPAWLRAQLGPDPSAAFERWAAAQPRSQPARLLERRLLAEADRGLRGAAAVSIALRGPDGARASLGLDDRLLGALIGLLTGGAQVAVAPGLVERGLALYAVAGLLAELGEGCAWAVEPEAALSIELPASAALVEAELKVGEARGRAWLAFEAATVARLAARSLPRGHALDRRARLSGVRALSPIELGRFPLPVAELASLGPGDLLLSPDCPREADSYPCLLRVGRGGLPGVATVGVAGSLRIEEPYRRGGPGMISSTEKSGQELAEDLQVEVTVELGRLSLSAAQLLDLEPGDVLALSRPLRAAVELRVGDRPIARGELCDVEGEAGVRLIEVFDS